MAMRRGVAGMQGGIALVIACALPAFAGAEVPVTGDLGPGAAVIDIRAEEACAKASLPDARCLPASWIIDPQGELLVGFHALRWLMGTVGLTGSESLAVYDEGPGATNDALAVAALAHLAGQAQVSVYTGAAVMDEPGGARAFSREVVYTAPMRVKAMVVSKTEAPMRDRLVAYARYGGTVAFASKD